VANDFRDGTGIYTEADIWNRPQFDFTDATNNGRVVSFNYRTVTNWNPDLNRDGDDNSLGAADVDDKFPVRVRLFTEHEDYTLWAGLWPDHLHDAGIDPADGGPVWYDDENDPPAFLAEWPDFIEGGAFVVDTGMGVYPLELTDDLNADDPHLTVEGGSNDYSVTFNYFIKYGTPNYTMDFQVGYVPGNAFGDPADGETIMGATTHSSNGANTYTMSVTTLPDGDYWVAARVTDSSVPEETSMYYWAAQVPLYPSLAWAIVDDTPYLCPTQMQSDATTIFGSTVPVLQSYTVTSSVLADYTLVWWICGRSSYPSELTATERTALSGYLDGGGSVVLFLTYDYYFYSYDGGTFSNAYVGINRSIPNSTGGGGYQCFPMAGNGEAQSPIRSGPGGNIRERRCYTSYPYSSYALMYAPNNLFGYSPGYATTGCTPWATWPFDSTTYWRVWITGLYKDSNGTADGGMLLWMGCMYYNSAPYSTTGTPVTRTNWLRNVADAMSPDFLP